MSLSFHDMQKEVDNWVSATPDGYWGPEKIIKKIREELKEVEVAECEYIKVRNSPDKDITATKLTNYKTEIGDVIFAVCCLANVHGINLEKSYTTAMEVPEIKDVPTTEGLSLPEQDIDFGDILCSLSGLVNLYGIQLTECFSLMMEKNKMRAKNNYKKETKQE